jgi:hypothetical protein
MADDTADWALPERIDICIACCYTPTYRAKDDRGTIAKAREVLDRYNIGLWVWPEDNGGQKGGGNLLTHQMWRAPVADDKEAYKKLRLHMYDTIKGSCNRKPVAFVVFSDYDHAGYGICPPSFKGIAPVVGETPGCLIWCDGNADGMDLLHELGHCAGLDHADPKDRDNFMNEANGRSLIREDQGKAFVRSWFSWAPS